MAARDDRPAGPREREGDERGDDPEDDDRLRRRRTRVVDPDPVRADEGRGDEPEPHRHRDAATPEQGPAPVPRREGREQGERCADAHDDVADRPGEGGVGADPERRDQRALPHLVPVVDVVAVRAEQREVDDAAHEQTEAAGEQQDPRPSESPARGDLADQQGGAAVEGREDQQGTGHHGEIARRGQVGL
ncbi:hypothetical protein [Patulibacter minatonensis]|uniref:hypothetical protein n=1 Tax=Patulibacter minatonensis TaxID=298163 RepID=UPI00047BC9ED|nr:hypothetical protein [Patulibacter minatonensis]